MAKLTDGSPSKAKHIAAEVIGDGTFVEKGRSSPKGRQGLPIGPFGNLDKLTPWTSFSSPSLS